MQFSIIYFSNKSNYNNLLNLSLNLILTPYTGCTGGVGQGKVLSNGLGSGAGHGGGGGYGYYNGSCIGGGITYGDPNLPCELGSGSGNSSLAGSTSGGGVLGKFEFVFLTIVPNFHFLFCCSFLII